MASKTTNPFKASEESKRRAAEERRLREEEERRKREEEELLSSEEEKTDNVEELPQDEPVTEPVQEPQKVEVWGKKSEEESDVIPELYDRYAAKHNQYMKKQRRSARLQCVITPETSDALKELAEKGKIKSANDLVNLLLEDYLRSYKARQANGENK